MNQQNYNYNNNQPNKNKPNNYSVLVSFKKKHLFFLSLFGSLLLAFVFMGGFSLAQFMSKKETSTALNLAASKRQQFPNNLHFNDANSIAASENLNHLNMLKEKESTIVFENGFNKDKENSLNTENNLNAESSLNTSSENSTKNNLNFNENLNTANTTKVQTIKKKELANPSNYEKQPKKGVEYYFLQIVATNSLEKAQNIANRLKEENFVAVIHKKEQSGIKNLAENLNSNNANESVFVVRVGLYKNKNKALQHLALLKNYAGFKDSFMRAYVN